MYEDITSQDIIDSVLLFPERKGKVKYAPVPTVCEPINVESHIKFLQMLAADTQKSKQNTSKPRKSGRISSKDIPDSLPSNLKQYTLPDGSVVCINTDETEFSEESVIDSIIKPK